MADLSGKTLFITGASRGIGKAIALRAARDGANIVIAAKTTEAHPKLPGTIHSAAEEIEAAGGKALALQVDIRDEAQIADGVARAVEHFGGIDILVNNASAISLTGTLETPMKRFDLMMGVNARGTFATSQACIPHLKRASNPHILMLVAAALDAAEVVRPAHRLYHGEIRHEHVRPGHEREFQGDGIAVNALWPRTLIATAALAMIPGVDPGMGRKPEIVADAAHAILTRDSRTCTGNFFIDDEVLAQEGVIDLKSYAVDPNKPLLPDLFLD